MGEPQLYLRQKIIRICTKQADVIFGKTEVGPSSGVGVLEVEFLWNSIRERETDRRSRTSNCWRNRKVLNTPEELFSTKQAR